MNDEIDDLTFAELKPDARSTIVQMIEERRGKSGNILQPVIEELQSRLGEVGLKAAISGHEKTPFSIWREMQLKNIDFLSVKIWVFLVIVDTIKDSYKALGVIHDVYAASPGGFDDSISTPKMDGYRSLDTTVIGHHSSIIIQIRTHKMHNIAEQLESTRYDPYTLHLRMLKRIADLEDAMRMLQPSSPGIGHNEPPEPIEPSTSGELNEQRILEAIALLKEQPAVPDRGLTEVAEAADHLKTAGEKIGEYLEDKSDSFVSEAVKAAGGEVGKWAARLVIWGVIANLLLESGQAVLDWLKALGYLL